MTVSLLYGFRDKRECTARPKVFRLRGFAFRCVVLSADFGVGYWVSSIMFWGVGCYVLEGGCALDCQSTVRRFGSSVRVPPDLIRLDGVAVVVCVGCRWG